MNWQVHDNFCFPGGQNLTSTARSQRCFLAQRRFWALISRLAGTFKCGYLLLASAQVSCRCSVLWLLQHVHAGNTKSSVGVNVSENDGLSPLSYSDLTCILDNLIAGGMPVKLMPFQMVAMKMSPEACRLLLAPLRCLHYCLVGTKMTSTSCNSEVRMH